MRIEPNIAITAALIGEPSRAAILTALFDGRALSAGELGRIAGVGATAASSHLSKLVEGKLLAVEVEGRHRYYRLTGPAVATVMEDLAQLAGQPAICLQPRLSPAARALRRARTCYDHLAGEIAVAICSRLEKRGYLKRGEGRRFEVGGQAARRWFAKEGVELGELKPGRWGIARQCFDWTERQPHLAGPLGSKLFELWCDADWIKRDPTRPRLIEITELGYRQFKQRLGVRLTEIPH